MPTYDYKCLNCGIVREIKAGINENPSLFHCGYKLMQKLVTKGSAIHFKGSGFYETDYKGK